MVRENPLDIETIPAEQNPAAVDIDNLPPPRSQDILGVPVESMGAHFMEGIQRGYTAKLIEPVFIKYLDNSSTTDPRYWKAGGEIVQENDDLNLKELEHNRHYSPGAEEFVIRQVNDSKLRQRIIEGSTEMHPYWNMIGGGIANTLGEPIFLVLIVIIVVFVSKTVKMKRKK